MLHFQADLAVNGSTFGHSMALYLATTSFMLTKADLKAGEKLLRIMIQQEMR